jgi:hypothetical protein
MLKGEYPPDKNPVFVRRVQQLLDSQFQESIYQGRREFKIYTPFQHMTKTKMVEHYLHSSKQLPDAVALLKKTQACYKKDLPMCGECMSCFNRWVAFSLNGIEEEYAKHPGQQMIERLRNLDRRDKNAVQSWKAIHRSGWAFEVYRALNAYTKLHFGRTIWSVLLL